MLIGLDENMIPFSVKENNKDLFPKILLETTILLLRKSKKTKAKSAFNLFNFYIIKS